MGTERSDRLHAAFREASDKLDYFLTGVAGALAAYVGQDLEVTALGLNGTTVELAALAAFAISFLSGVRRLELGHVLLRENSRQLRLLETAGMSTEAALLPTPSINTATGEIYSPGQLAQKGADAMAKARAMEEGLRKLEGRAVGWYRARSRFLVSGVVLLVLARLLPVLRP